jgi:Tripartite tricarboxylate transporter family receptor
MMAIAAVAVAGVLWSSNPAQSDYPNRPITIVVPFAAGGPWDVVARLVSGPMSRQLGQPVVVQNVIGGGGTVGTLRTKRAAPDGYTIMTGQTGTHAAAVAFQPSLPYDPRTDGGRGFSYESGAFDIDAEPAEDVRASDQVARGRLRVLNLWRWRQGFRLGLAV